MSETLQFETSLGTVIAVGSSRSLEGVYFSDQRHLPDLSSAPANPDSLLLHRARKQIEEYLAGRRTRFDLPLALRGTELQQQVWRALDTIAYGQTMTYSGLASAIGRPLAVRAVAQAVGRNPWLIIRPCHRVVGSDGSLRGFAAGLDRKTALLALEHRTEREPGGSHPTPGGPRPPAD